MNTPRFSPQTAAGADLVDARRAGRGKGRHCLRRGGSLGKDHGHGAEFSAVGHALLSEPALWIVRKDHCFPAPECALGAAAPADGAGDGLAGEKIREPAHRPVSGRENQFYLFGGRDESSAALIQGITFAGVLLDEAALMPRSFVDQACARCSVAGSRLWFNCNPAGPNHWFYKTWIVEAEKRNCLRLHFTMEDNPSLTPAIRERYQRMYTGVFFQRYILASGSRPKAGCTTSSPRRWWAWSPEHCRQVYISATTAQ